MPYKDKKLHKQKCREYYLKNKEKKLLKDKEYRSKNKDKIKQNNLLYRLKHKDALRIYRRVWKKNQRKTNPLYKFKCNWSRRIISALKGQRKGANTEKLLGCSIKEFRNHLQSQFKSGMTWGNYGTYGWHIDHIRPCSSFDFSDPEQQKQCFHYTNLQPLWATTEIARQNGDFESIGNIEKGDKFYVV